MMTRIAAQPQAELNKIDRSIAAGIPPWERPFEEIHEETIRENDELFRLLAQGPPKDWPEKR